MAAAAFAAGTGFEVAFLGYAAEFEGLAHILADRFVDPLHFFLGIEEAAGDGVAEEGLAQFFEFSGLGLGDGCAGMLFFVEQFAAGHQGFVLGAGLVIGHEGLDVLAEGADFRLVENGLAEFPRLEDDRRCFGFGLSLHNVSVFFAGRHLVRFNRRDNTTHAGQFGKEAILRKRVDFRLQSNESSADKSISAENVKITSMELYILRHAMAEAAPNPPSGGDSRRRLTAEGAEKMRRAAKGIKTLKLSFDLILSSPYLRAKETAEIVADVLHADRRLEMTSLLQPDGNLKEFIEELKKKHSDKKSVLLVGHEPGLSRLISVLISGGTQASIEMKKGALCKLNAESLEHGRCAALEWLMTNRQLRRLG